MPNFDAAVFSVPPALHRHGWKDRRSRRTRRICRYRDLPYRAAPSARSRRSCNRCPRDTGIEIFRFDNAALHEVDGFAQQRVEHPISTKPGTSFFTTTGKRPIERIRSRIVTTVSGAVFSPPITSIIGMMCGGFDQCIANHPFGMRDMGLQFGDRDAGRVRGDDDRRMDQRVDRAVSFALMSIFSGTFSITSSAPSTASAIGLHQTHRTGARSGALMSRRSRTPSATLSMPRARSTAACEISLRPDLKPAARKPRCDTRTHRSQSDEGGALDHHAAFAGWRRSPL